MRKMHKLVLQFKGTKFEGWQRQTRTPTTIQGNLEKALSKVFKTDILVKGSGRTDSGVHAFFYTVVFEKAFEIPDESLVRALNSHLSADIRVLSCSKTDIKSPTSEAKSRTYHYYFSNQSVRSPFLGDIMENITYELNFELMKKACELFKGEHDFNRFHCKGSEPNSTVRTIFDCSLKNENAAMCGLIPPHFFIKVEGSGFLKQMVRLIVGAIWDVGRGRLSLQELEESLRNPSVGTHVSCVAPANGLVKFLVEYE